MKELRLKATVSGKNITEVLNGLKEVVMALECQVYFCEGDRDEDLSIGKYSHELHVVNSEKQGV